MENRRKLIVAAATAVMIIPAAFVFALVVSRIDGFRGVQHALWYARPDHPALMVTGYRYESPETGASYTSYGWVLVDPDTGRTSDREWIADDHEFASADGSRVLTTSGAFILYEGDGGLTLREGTSGREQVGAALARRWPMIAAPWYQTRVVGPGTLAIEADDRRWWTVDIATRSATPSAPPAAYANVRGCVSMDWPQPDGKVWTFEHVTPERHSDPNDWGLVRATRLMYAQLADVEPLGLRLPYAWFNCDQRTSRTALFDDGSALIGVHSASLPSTYGFAKLGPDQRIAWTWSSGIETGPNIVNEVFGYRGGFLVILGTTVVSLADDGRVRWRTTVGAPD